MWIFSGWIYRNNLSIFKNRGIKNNFIREKTHKQKINCPVVENLHKEVLFHHEFIVPSMSFSDIDDVVAAFEKVWDNKNELIKK